MADFDMRQLDSRARYNLITGTVVPRPIALITSLNEDGAVNAAPFAFFNAFGSTPPIVAFSAGLHSVTPERPKDTRANALRTGEFVVNMVSSDIAEVLSVASAVFPVGESEVDFLSVDLAPSAQIETPRIRQSPVNLECQLVEEVVIGVNHIVFGEVVHIHIADELIDTEKMYINYNKVDFVGRMPGGSGVYISTREPWVMPGVSYDQIKQGKTTRDIAAGDAPQEEAGPQKLSEDYDRALRAKQAKDV